MTDEGRKPWTRREIGGKEAWDWLDLLLVPLVLGIVAAGLTAWFNAQQNTRQNDIEDRRARAEREVAEQRAQDEALQAYLDQMSNLLLEKDLRNSEEDSETRILARARTLTVLGRLDPNRKTDVMHFLVEAELIQSPDEEKPILELTGANLKGANLIEADLRGARLAGANLSDANLGWTDLRDARLGAADLSGAILVDTNLSDADLRVVNLRVPTWAWPS